jgi:hypothetical protein
MTIAGMLAAPGLALLRGAPVGPERPAIPDHG